MAKLVDVYHPDKPLERRQLPLVVDKTLTMVMDLKSMGLVCDNRHIKGKEVEEFTRKLNILTDSELRAALQVTKQDMLRVLNQAVPCVGCRRSVERFYYQLSKYRHPTLDPIVIKSDGIITIRDEKQTAQVLCSLFHAHSTRLNNLVDSQIRRNKKSHRCLLHSLDSQRTRPITPAWKDVWDCMRPECKKDTCIIDASSLHATLETYLRKHRFCGECRTKVLKAYTLLVEEPEPTKEKGYVAALYSGIEKRCLEEKHIHLLPKTDYITKLISRAEPELLGSRRERHAKTLEIAQEEVLTCLGICMYERLHRIYMRMKEEECTCQVFAAVVVDALCRSFETTVERIQGVSQLELLFAELTKEEQQKQIRKEQKKLKRKRKKEKMTDQDGTENCNHYENDVDFEDKDDTDKDCSCSSTNVDCTNELNCKSCSDLSYDKKIDLGNKFKDSCNDIHLIEKGKCNNSDVWLDNCKCNNEKLARKVVYNKFHSYLPPTEYTRKENCSSSDHSHDCGYSSENNNGYCENGSLASSLPSSPEGSELACSDGCCHLERDYLTLPKFTFGNGQLSLQEMLEDGFYCDNEGDCYITAEEVQEFQSNNRHVYEQRQELRETLQKRFAQLCVNGPLQVPRMLVQTKYASN
ncbi:hypothetical protein RN001_012020 [Aquatica leii]|uniref:Gametogenetin-binding protein 2-like n=1 Tax=Aquatica leii TaxID=1421715 RepID=A0AAN7QEF9_9COLE|nr:hypothetical protein RN001_012020 [Aquatica leii]